MEIEIQINDVSDADAIFIGLSKPDKKLVVVLDGGRQKNSDSVMANLNDFLNKYGKTSPDLVIGSHYDNDHIAGLLPIIKHYNKRIGELWMFDTDKGSVVMEGLKKGPMTEKGSIFPGESDVSIGGAYSISNITYAGDLITTLEKEQEILSYARGAGILTREPIAGCSYPGWEELQVIGPTPSYYAELFPESLAVETLLKETMVDIPDEFSGKEDPCAGLDKEQSPISRINLNSAIINIQMGERKFLFSADAGIQSFLHILEYKVKLKDIFWLKMPHHGSSNNINNDLINLFSPKHVAISGDKYISDTLVSCMSSKGIQVRTTREEKAPLIYHFTEE